MTPEQKSQELIDKFKTYAVMWSGGIEVENQNAKQCAIICVDEILKELPSQIHEYNKEVELEIIYNNPRYQFWYETKQAIQNA